MTVVQDRGRAAALAKLSMLVVGGMSAAGGLLAIITAPWLVRIVLGSEYGASVNVLRILALALPLRAASNVLGMQWLLPSGHERPVSIVLVCTVLINLGLALFFAPRWLQEGMAWAVVISECAGLLGLGIAARKCRVTSFVTDPAEARERAILAITRSGASTVARSGE